MKPAKTKFILTRHTSTEWNLLGRFQGQADTKLNDQGRAEAEQLAQKLEGLGINLIISSNLKRAYETAAIVNRAIGATLIADERLKECSFGKIEGLTKEEAVTKFGESIIPHWEDQFKSYDFRQFGGENQSAVLTRHLELFKEISEKYSGKTILLIGHGRGLSTLLHGLGAKPELKRGEYRIVEAGIKKRYH